MRTRGPRKKTSPKDRAELYTPHVTNSRREIAQLVLARWRLYVFYDHADECFRFQHYRDNKLISSKSSPANEQGLLDLFAQNAESVSRQFMIAHRLNKRSVNMHYVPLGTTGIRTFDPSKRNTNRSLFDHYSVTLPVVNDDQV